MNQGCLICFLISLLASTEVHTFVLCGTVSRIEQVSSTLCFKKPTSAIIRTENLCSLEPCHSWGLFCVCLNSECFMSEFLLTIICSEPHTETSLKLCSCHIDSVQQFQMSGFLFFCLVFFFSIPSVCIWLHPFSTFLLAITLYDFAICSVLALCWRLAGLFLLQTGNLHLNRTSNKLDKQHYTAQQSYFFLWWI